MTHEEARIAADRDARPLLDLVRKLSREDLARLLTALPTPLTFDQRAVYERINARACQGE